MPDGSVGGLADARRRRHLDPRRAGPAPTHAYVSVLREAMAVDRLDPVGVYFGTSNGQLYGSRDEGQSWDLIADNLPAIWSVEAACPD